MSTRTISRPQPKVHMHKGMPVLVDEQPITIAKIPINGQELHNSLLLHPRYVPDGIRHESVTFRGLRLGRTIDVLLDEPLLIDGKPYYVLTFKGVGANATREMVIHPTHWFETGNGWVSRHIGDPVWQRRWGAMTSEESIDEFSDQTLNSLNIKNTPHVSINIVPRDISQHIIRSEYLDPMNNIAVASQSGYSSLAIDELEFPFLQFSQISRVCITNIRFIHSYFMTKEQKDQYSNPSELATIDANVMLAQMALAKDGKMLRSDGETRENRYIDGMFTDRENYSVQEYNRAVAIATVTDVISSSIHFLSESKIEEYLQMMEELTGLAFTRLIDRAVSIPGILKHHLKV